jgi:hypothetical protein
MALGWRRQRATNQGDFVNQHRDWITVRSIIPIAFHNDRQLAVAKAPASNTSQ